MKIKILFILLSISLFSSDIPFDANLRIHLQGDSVSYSSRLNLIEFKNSKIIYIFEQKYDISKNKSENKYSIKYIYYW